MKKLFVFLLLGCLVCLKPVAINPEQLMKIDYSKTYKSSPLSDLRLIRSMVYARHGFLFGESDLRDFFMNNYKWYDSLVWHNAELEWNGQKLPPVVLSGDEKKFVDKIDLLIQQKQAGNLMNVNGLDLPVVDNMANVFMADSVVMRHKKMLTKYGFSIEPASHEQLFHLYDQNCYQHMPSFVTTDLFLQLFHTYFSYTLKSLEKEQLVGLITKLSETLCYESSKHINTAKNANIKRMAEFNTCYFAVAYTLISNKRLTLPASIADDYKVEIEKVLKGEDGYSTFFRSPLAYSLFIPRAHYTRTDEQKRYFRAMMWLQIAPFCLSDRQLLENACFNGFMLWNGKTPQKERLRDVYRSVYDPIAFLVGESDNLSVFDICDIIDRYGLNTIDKVTSRENIDLIGRELAALEKQKDKIQPKIKETCFPKINFMPQRYLVDNDILQQFVDTTRNAAKALPKGLDVFSVMGVESATDLLYNFYGENKKWKEYDNVFREQRQKFLGFNDWNKTLYNKWLQSLIALNKSDKTYPGFMQTRGWQLKSLNTSLASWAQLKHDVALYGEQPMAAESGDGGDELPPPVTVGYIEPNIAFWNTCHDLMEQCDEFLTKYHLKNQELTIKTASVKSLLDFFISISLKELSRQPLTKEEYQRIEYIGGEFDYLSLSMLNPYVSYNYWEDVTGPDKTIALVSDIYTRNIRMCPQNAILHEATGFGNTIYVLVEINGYLYLTRGATYTYYEFPYDERLTDESWLDLLKQNIFQPAQWMEEITVH
jgi:hypothetical protein